MTDSSGMNRDGRLAKTAGYYAAFIVFGGAEAALGPTLPALADQSHTALSAISFLFTARSLGYLLGSLSAGRLFDRLPGQPLLAGVLLFLAAALVVVPLPHVLWLLTAGMFVVGLAGGGVEVGSNALLLWVHGDKAAPFVNGLHFFFGVGASLSPIAVTWAARLLGAGTWAYWLLALLALPVAAWIVRLPSPARPAAGTGAGGRPRVDWRLVALVTLFFFLYAGIELSFGGWIFSYATARRLATESGAGYLTSAFWGALTLGRLVAIPLATRVRPALMVLADLAVGLLAVSLLLFFPHSSAVMWVATLMLGLGLASIVPTALAFVGERTAITGTATGLFFVGLGSGAMTIPVLIGQLFGRIGAQTMPVVLAVDVILGLALFSFITFYGARRPAHSRGA